MAASSQASSNLRLRYIAQQFFIVRPNDVICSQICDSYAVEASAAN